MSSIKNLAASDAIAANDLVPFWSTANGTTRRATASSFANLISQYYIDQAVAQADAKVKADLAASAGSSLIGFVQAGTGAVVQTAQDKLRQRYTLADYYNAADGSAAMFNALTRVCNAAARETIEIDLGDSDWTLNADFTFPATKRVLVRGHGAVNFAGGSFIRAHHGLHTALRDFKATGAYPAFKFSASPSGSAYKEIEIVGLECAMSAGVWAIYLDGAREAVISRCYFRAGNGIYRTQSNICYISNCFFLGLGFAINDDGQGSAFSCGINLSNSEILGCNRSLVVSQCDDGDVSGCTIDYNDEGIYLLGQDRFKIFGGYIGTRTAIAATPNVAIGGVTPAINIIGTVSVPSEKIKIIGSVVTGHHPTDAQYDCIYAEYAAKLTIADTELTFFTRNGLRYGAGVTDLSVHDCNFANRGGTSTYAVECISTDDSSNRIHHNNLPASKGIVAPFANIQSNTRFLTAQQGEAISGSAASSVTAALTLAYTPSKQDVTLTPTNAAAAAAGPYVSAVTATLLTIGFNTATTAAAGVRWRVEKSQIAG